MIPLTVYLGALRCDCQCHSNGQRHEKECCYVCEYCKFRVKKDHYASHKMCHEANNDRIKNKK